MRVICQHPSVGKSTPTSIAPVPFEVRVRRISDLDLRHRSVDTAQRDNERGTLINKAVVD